MPIDETTVSWWSLLQVWGRSWVSCRNIESGSSGKDENLAFHRFDYKLNRAPSEVLVDLGAVSEFDV